MKFLITGGAGFIGSAVVRRLMAAGEHSVVVLDALTYAGNLTSIPGYQSHPKLKFAKIDLRNAEHVHYCVMTERPNVIMHLAAESHVDRSINGPAVFLETNISGTFNLLQAARELFESLPEGMQRQFRFHHISTDEVFGDLAIKDKPFSEQSRYLPSSPYSASKAAADHFVRAWSRTYGLPCIITNCSNNYGPYQFPEKLIPHIVLSALRGDKLPVYGNGQQIRDWLYVDDHVEALLTVAKKAQVGKTYNIGGNNEVKNIDVVTAICGILEESCPAKENGIKDYKDLITFVEDRPGHDKRYAIDSSRINQELGWQPAETFQTGLKKTVNWYLNNRTWWASVLADQ